MDKKESVTVRMNVKNVEKLRKYSRMQNVSQGKFIENLIESCDDKGNNNVLRSSTSEGKIEYLLRYENYFLKDKEKQFREPIKYVVPGEYKYGLQSAIQIPIEEVISLLKEDFKIDEDLKNYILRYWISIGWDKKRERYVINEIFDIRIQGAIKAMLNVSRCKSAINLREIRNHIEGYVPTEVLANIEASLVDITDDDNVFDRFLN